MGLRELITGEKSIQAFFNVYLGLSPLYLISAERELGLGYADLVLEPFIAQYPALKYAYLLEFKYIKPTGSKKHKPSPQQIQELKKAAEAQLTQYSRDERFTKCIGKTTLKKLVLIFCGHRMVYAEEV